MERTSVRKSSPNQQVNDLSEYFVIGLTSIFIAWYLQYLWRRRYLYLSSFQLQGPLALPIVGSAFSFIGDTTYAMEKVMHMHNIYPGIFRLWFGTRLIYALSDPKHIEIVLTSPHAMGKSFFYRLLQTVFGVGLVTAPVSMWKRNRKMINPSFNQRVLDTFVDIFVKQSKIFVEVMRNKCARSEDIDIFISMTKLTLDSIMETEMGLELNTQTSDSDIPVCIARLGEIGIQRFSNIFYHTEFTFKHSSLGRKCRISENKLKSLASKVITEKRTQYEKKIQGYEYVDKGSSKIKPFLDLLLEMENENNRFSDAELVDETVSILLAATDTTAFSNCCILTMLGMHQDVQEKVLAEVLEVIGPDRDVNFSDLPKLKYMERAVKETLRLFPAVPFISRDVDENIDLGDCVMQKGASVVIAIAKVHRDEKYWPEPLKYDPDRFLPEEIAKRPSGSYLPFSYGPRNCIGMTYAMMSMKSFLATILRKYRVYTSYEKVEDVKVKSNIVLRLIDGFKISLEFRN